MNPTAVANKEKILAVLYTAGKYAKEQPKLLGTIENKLGIKDWLESQGHEYIVTDDKEGPNSEFQKHIKDATCVITTPFHPAYLTRDVMNKADKLKIAITAGVGSDHIDLNAANERKITVAEVTGSNVVAVAEHVLMTILNLVRNFVPAHEQIMRGEWDVAQVARNSYDLEGKVVGTIGAGRIGYRVLQRLKPFDCKELLYFDYQALPKDAADAVGVRRVDDLKDFLSQCDIVTVNAPLHEGTHHLINDDTIKSMKPGSWLINTARGAICDAAAVKRAMASGHINGYGGDVWDTQPAPADHPLRSAFNTMGGGNAMTAHISGTSLDSQERYANGVKEILDNYFNKKEQNPANLIVTDGQYASKAYGKR
ncbi:putative formate dehydrogenase [Wallemia ichthyophaga EXF-994]|uniref:Formate dehydrogenase n=1 Tax=Wallemia ichthyophaga (strain EXF-994 / CBS 113033) TaxID=1299270 RepID=R9ACW6_WALI9|nr:putative formate dehydrogenase [Wallemia ichthyophaga EXF-994]EOQ99987.1 putative formate dehydrogenase [Wallemia ichthyophaga EXF-994]